jgi:hypothetical protein
MIKGWNEIIGVLSNFCSLNVKFADRRVARKIYTISKVARKLANNKPKDGRKKLPIIEQYINTLSMLYWFIQHKIL